MADHTPGPWRLEHFDRSPHSRIQPAKGIADGGSIADVYGNKANAHLIAAAPELLAALKAILDQFAPAPGQRVTISAVIEAEYAVAKAEGR